MKFLKIFKQREPESLSEAEKLSAYRRTGDIKLLGTLYEPYMEQVFSICYKYFKDENAGKDAVMQIFEKLITDLKTHEISNFKSWLHTVARNHCLMELRSRRVFVTTEDVAEQDLKAAFSMDEYDEPLLLDGQLTSLEKCLGTLASGQKQAVELFYLQEKCYQEISLETGFDLNKVKSYIQNGKRNLKICMDKNGKK